ncbi:MAG: 50S ribosomal protein L2 [Thermoplasmatales archaeon]|nr:50S ribosomal protein L2 [Thermoplasmatales archaeon]
MGKRLRLQRRGRGSIWESPSFKHKGPVAYPSFGEYEGVIEDIIHNPGSTAPLAIVRLNDGREIKMVAYEGAIVGEKIKFTGESIFKAGNVLPLASIPQGAPIYNIEGMPGDGGKFVRSAGSYATIISHEKDFVIVRLPSGKDKRFLPQCRATVGLAAGGGREEKPILKAGKKYHMFRSRAKLWPIVSGVAMNPVNHPHGGGSHQHVGRPKTVARGAPPGRKVGSISARRTGKR